MIALKPSQHSFSKNVVRDMESSRYTKEGDVIKKEP